MARAVAAALAPVLAILLALPAAAAPPRAAALKLESLRPLTVSGHSFGPREKVLLMYRTAEGKSRVATAQATKRGRFRASFRIRVDRCESFTVRAVGTAGSRAVLQVERRCGKRRGPPQQAPRKEPDPGDR